jgi:hypothetical protein
VAHPIVGLAEQRFRIEAADPREGLVDEGEQALGIGHGDREGALLQAMLDRGHWPVVAHGCLLMAQPC